MQDGYTTGKVSGTAVPLTDKKADVLAERIWWGDFPTNSSTKVTYNKGFYMMEDDGNMKTVKSLEDLEQKCIVWYIYAPKLHHNRNIVIVSEFESRF